MLLVPFVRGYDFTTKRWAEFDTDNIEPVTWSDAAFDRLVLSAPRKRILKALIESNTSHKGELDDNVHGKGE